MKVLKREVNKPLIFIALLILLLDFAALDDITTGNQPNYWGEWDILIGSIFVFGLIVYSKLGKSTR